MNPEFQTPLIHCMRGAWLVHNVFITAEGENGSDDFEGLALLTFLIEKYKIATKYDERLQQWVAVLPVQFKRSIIATGEDFITAAMRAYLEFKEQEKKKD